MPLLYQCIAAFFVGGLFCVAAQLLIDLTRLSAARILVSYVVLGVLLGAVGLYEPLYAFAGAGASVPLVGFGGNIAHGVRTAVHTKGLFGALTGPLTAAAGGTAAALVFSFLAACLVSGRPKRL